VDFASAITSNDAASVLPVYAIALGLASLRFSAFFSVFPLLNRSNAGSTIPNCLSVALGLPLVENLVSKLASEQAVTGWVLLAIALKEIVCGLLLGVASGAPIWSIHMAGELIDNLRGVTADSSQEPVGRGQGSALNVFFGFLAINFFFSIGGLQILVGIIYGSFVSWPILTPTVHLPAGNIVTMLGGILQQIMLYATVIAGPFIVIFLSCSFAGMLVAKSAQQIVTEQTVSLVKNILFVILSGTYVLYMSQYFIEHALTIPKLARSAIESIAE
jgi:type III secretion protein T